jgi:hypothetical protein
MRQLGYGDCGFESHRRYGVVCCRGLCDKLITRPEESYRLGCVVVCDLENFINKEALIYGAGGAGLMRQKLTKQKKFSLKL